MRRAACALLLAASCGTSDAGPPPPTARAVETVPVVSRTLSTVESLPAELTPYQAVDVYPKVTGFLDEIRVDVGSRVKKGELLMRLSAPELVAQQAQANAALQSARAQLTTARAKLTADAGTYEHLSMAARTPGAVAANDVAIAEQAVEAARGSVAAAEHNVSAARDALRAVSQLRSYLDVYAPFDGTVTKRNLHPGALVGPAAGQSDAHPIVRLVDTRRLRAIVSVPQAETAAMKLGTQVAFTVPAYLGQEFIAPIARISTDVDVESRTMHVELEVQNADGRLSPGSYATVSWPVERSYPTLFVPISAVTSDQQRMFVIRVADGRAQRVSVKTGKAVNEDIEVVGDLQPGDQVVRPATDSIRDGDEVTVAPQPVAPEAARRD